MQWSTGKNAGFSTAKQTWLPVAPDYKECSVEVESKLSDSFLALYKQLINLRKSTSAIRIGSIDIEQDGGDVLAYTRKHGRESYTTIVNFSDQPNAYPFGRDGHILLSSRGPRAEMVQPHSTIKLEPHEAIVIAKAQ
jgi:glycosidase